MTLISEHSFNLSTSSSMTGARTDEIMPARRYARVWWTYAWMEGTREVTRGSELDRESPVRARHAQERILGVQEHALRVQRLNE